MDGPARDPKVLLLALLLGAAAWVCTPYAKLAFARMKPREGASLAAVSPDGTRLVLIERPGLRAVLREEQRERALGWGAASQARLGPGVVFVAETDLMGQPGGVFLGFKPGCERQVPKEARSSPPVWRADGGAMLRRAVGGIVYDGPRGCERLDGATSAAFVGETPAWSDGSRVWLGGQPVWQGTRVRLMMAAGAAWLRAEEGFGELSAEGVQLRETEPGGVALWEMPQGVCLFDDPESMLVLARPLEWGARCWRPGDPAVMEHPRGAIPLDVDLRFEPDTRTLRALSSGETRQIPKDFPVLHSTRVLPDGALRSFTEAGYWQLDPAGALTELRWDPLDPLPARDGGESTWRALAEID